MLLNQGEIYIMEIITTSNDYKCQWYGMDDFKIILEKSNHIVELTYKGEPPHGDSYHKMKINDFQVPGLTWGGMYMFPYAQEYIICSWMSKLYERKTIIIDIRNRRYYITKDYWTNAKVENNKLILGDYKFKKTMILEINQISDWKEINHFN